MPGGMWEIILGGLSDALKPVVDAAVEEGSSGAGLKRLSLEIGFNLDGLLTPQQATTFANDISAMYADVESIVQNPDGFAGQIPDLLTHIKSFVNTLNGLDSIDASLVGLGRGLLDYVVTSYLEARTPSLTAVLEFLDLIHRAPVAAIGNVPAYERRQIIWDSFPKLAKPADLFQTAYGWGQPTLNSNLLLARLSDLLWALGLPATYAGRRDPGTDGAMDLKWTLELGLVTMQLGLEGVYLPAAADPPGLALLPHGLAAIDQTLPLGGGLELELKAAVGAQGGYQLTIRPPGKVGLELTAGGGAVAWTLEAQLSLRTSSTGRAPTILFGATGQTRLTAKSVALTARALAAPDQGQVGIEVVAVGCELTVVPSQGDGFLKSVLPNDLTVQTDFTLGWSTAKGLYFKGSSGLEVAISVHKSAGPFHLELVTLALRAPATGGLEFVAAATGSVVLGPLTVSVESVGVGATLKPGPPPALAFAFKPPHGLGLRVDASAVIGGGFLAHDDAKQQYSGALQLEFVNKFDFKAIGFLTTAPDKYSFMAVIFIDGFKPIEIGLGFTLIGIGGVVGMNRMASPEVLRSKLGSKARNPLLFPDDPIGQAPQILSDLQADFPYAPNRFLFGPIAEIGWGEPTLLTIKLGIILELPAPIRLILLGELEALIPNKTWKQVEIHMNALGVIDFGRGEAALDAVLHDSRISGFTLTGAMAFRMSWGATRSLLLSVGGLNPHFQAPAGFPKLDRLAIALSSGGQGDHPSISLDAYFALTSNTVQFGSHLALYVKLSPFIIEGHLGFDALIHFSPFSFVADFEGDITLAWDSGAVIGAVSLAITLSGPQPWKAHVVVQFSVFPPISADWRSGPDVLPEPVADPQLETQLVAALNQIKNWGAAPVDGSHTLVTLRPQAAQDGVVAAHPLGELTVHQRVLPLDVLIDSYGGAPLKTAVKFHIDPAGVLVGGQQANPLPTTLTDYFATGQYRRLNDDERLSRPSFEPYAAGLRFTVSGTSHGAGSDAQLTYNVVVVDPTSPYPPAPRSTYQPSGQDLAAHVSQGSAAQAPSVRTGRAKYAAPRRILDIDDTTYVIASRRDLTRQAAVDGGTSGTYTQMQDLLQEHLKLRPQDDLQVVARREAR